MSLIAVEKLSLSHGGNPIFSDVSFIIKRGDKIGLVGDNGVGKSSLLRCIAKEKEACAGQVTHVKGLRCHYVEQGFPEEWSSLTAIEVLEKNVADPWAEKWKAEYVLELFNFPIAFYSLGVSQLSGGWKKVLMIANAFLAEPDVLLLDEPTNHLDQEQLENIIRVIGSGGFSFAIVLASHNRNFLEKLTTRTVFIHEKKVVSFNAPFTQARKMLKEKVDAAAASHSQFMGNIGKLKKSADFHRQLGVNNYSDRALQKAKQLEKKIQVLESAAPVKIITRERNIALSIDSFNAKKIMHVDDFSVCSPCGYHLFNVASLTIKKGERVVISGPNGSGKSLFLKAICSGVESSIKLGPSVQCGFFDQELSTLPLEGEVLDFIMDHNEIDRQHAINELAFAGFAYGDAKKKINLLSHGERARLLVLTLRLKQPNFLILDEPTNHLDISAQEMLEDEIHRLNPAAIIVSHDIEFVKNVGTHFYEIKQGMLRVNSNVNIDKNY